MTSALWELTFLRQADRQLDTERNMLKQGLRTGCNQMAMEKHTTQAGACGCACMLGVSQRQCPKRNYI